MGSPVPDITGPSETDKARRLAYLKCTHLKYIKEMYVSMMQERYGITRVLDQVHFRAQYNKY